MMNIKGLLTCLLLTFTNGMVWAAESTQAEQAMSPAQTSLQSLLRQVRSDGLTEKSLHTAREQAFLQSRHQQQEILAASQQQLSKTKAVTQSLKQKFDDNEASLTKFEEALRQRLGNLGEMFGVVRQVSQDLAAIREHSLLAVELGANSPILDKLADSKALPSIKELESLWYELQRQMTKQGEVKKFTGDYIDTQGQKVTSVIAHVGPFMAINQDGYLNYDSETRMLLELAKQPSAANLVADYFASEAAFSELALDPTRGVLLGLSSQNPSVMDRIHQGGLIGYIIIALAVSGLLYALYLLLNMLKTNAQVKRQLRDTENVQTDNPLGRILSVYHHQYQEADLETLEMKLDEAVLKELPSLEKGLSLLKLLAAVAPLLGLLGTVTGMIATFQSITLFGTGDPKLMAGGISQALITTVLGLVAAIPLLFMHNIVSSRSRELVQILDQQSAGLIAEKAQKGL